MKESDQECSKLSDGKAAVESRQELSGSIWQEMKQQSTAPAAERSGDKATLDIPPAFGSSHILEELNQFQMQTRAGKHHPMEMVISSGHAVDDDFRIFANPAMRDAAEQQREFDLQSQVELEAAQTVVLRRIPHARGHHHRAAETPADNHSGQASPIRGAEVEHPLDPSTLRIPVLPAEQPIPSRPIEIDREPLLSRANRAAQSNPFHRNH